MNMPDDREMGAEELAFATASDVLLVKSLDHDRSFTDAVDDFRQLEVEFVSRAGGNEFDVIETRRRIVETILLLAHHKRPPFEVCREAWNDLLRLGFTNIERECRMAWYYADCCAYGERPNEGLAVLEPLIAELERLLAEPTVTEEAADYYQDELGTLGKLRARLKAQQGKP